MEDWIVEIIFFSVKRFKWYQFKDEDLLISVRIGPGRTPKSAPK